MCMHNPCKALGQRLQPGRCSKTADGEDADVYSKRRIYTAWQMVAPVARPPGFAFWLYWVTLHKYVISLWFSYITCKMGTLSPTQ